MELLLCKFRLQQYLSQSFSLYVLCTALDVKRIVGFCPEIVHTKFFDLKGNQWIRNNDALPFRKLEAFLLFYFKSQPNASPPSDSTLKFNINSSTNSDYCKFNKDQFNSTESRHLHGIPVLFDSKSKSG
jgi:hypothetical protein